MPRIMFNMKLTEKERKLLAKRAKANGVTESDYLRMAMGIEAVTAGDPLAFEILGANLRAMIGQRFGFSGGLVLAPSLSK